MKVCGWTNGSAQRKATCWWVGNADTVIKENRCLWKEWKKGNYSKEMY